jgi:hypothetical protein
LYTEYVLHSERNASQWARIFTGIEHFIDLFGSGAGAIGGESDERVHFFRLSGIEAIRIQAAWAPVNSGDARESGIRRLFSRNLTQPDQVGENVSG